MKERVSSAMFSVLINGYPKSFFLASEVCSFFVCDGGGSSELHAREALVVRHLQFTDDSLIFCADEQQSKIVKRNPSVF